MSTRLGVKRTAEVVSAEERTGKDGQLYYDTLVSEQAVAHHMPMRVPCPRPWTVSIARCKARRPEPTAAARCCLSSPLQTRVRSYASRNQLAVTQAEIEEGVSEGECLGCSRWVHGLGHAGLAASWRGTGVGVAGREALVGPSPPLCWVWTLQECWFELPAN